MRRDHALASKTNRRSKSPERRLRLRTRALRKCDRHHSRNTPESNQIVGRSIGFFADLQYREKRLLRDLDLADLFHALFARLLLLEKLALARDVAAVAFGQDILAHRLDACAR